MIPRQTYEERITKALRRAPIVALLGSRQCGKTTLAGSIAQGSQATIFDLESPQDLARLQNPELVLSALAPLGLLCKKRVPWIFNVCLNKPGH